MRNHPPFLLSFLKRAKAFRGVSAQMARQSLRFKARAIVDMQARAL
jgi:hypothetical protein